MKEKREFVYPWLVTEEVTNLAICASGPRYPYLCFRSMVGEDLRVDFVVFEYFNILSGHERKLWVLAERARARFPEATFIFLMVPLPGQYVHIPSQRVLTQYVNDQQPDTFQPHLYESMTFERIESALNGTKAEDWKLNYYDEPTKEVFDAANAVGGIIWNPFEGTNSTAVPVQKVKENTVFCFRDGNHFSISGHGQVAAAIRTILKEQNTTRSDVVGNWDSYDYCHSWYQSGRTKLEHSPMNMFSWGSNQEAGLVHGKYALELARNESNWIKIVNPTHGHLYLFIYYMATSPRKFYPVVNLTITSDRFLLFYEDGDEEQTTEHQVQIIPLATVHSSAMAREFHLIKGTNVGPLSPGEHYVRFEPIEEAERPFRITGIALSENGDEDSIQGYFE